MALKLCNNNNSIELSLPNCIKKDYLFLMHYIEREGKLSNQLERSDSSWSQQLQHKGGKTCQINTLLLQVKQAYVRVLFTEKALKLWQKQLADEAKKEIYIFIQMCLYVQAFCLQHLLLKKAVLFFALRLWDDNSN